MRGKYLSPRQIPLRRSTRASASATSCSAGIPRPALRQHDRLRLAHRLPRRAGAPRSSSSCRRLPWSPDTLLLVLGRVRGDYAAVCPRGVLRPRARARGALGFDVEAAFEYEFFLFDETPTGARQGLPQPHALTPGMFGYSMLRKLRRHSDFYHELLDTCERHGHVEIEGLHTETGPGVLEAAIRRRRPAAGRRQGRPLQDLHQGRGPARGLMATFMAKWSPTGPARAATSTSRSTRRPAASRSSTTRGRAVGMSPTRCATSSPAAGRCLPELLAMVADGQRLSPPRPRLLGADAAPTGASRTARRRSA
jgi:glutamine synthetase